MWFYTPLKNLKRFNTSSETFKHNLLTYKNTDAMLDIDVKEYHFIIYMLLYKV